MGLREEHFPGRPLGRPPVFDPSLQGSQLPVLILARLSPLENLKNRLRFQAMVVQ